MRRLPTSGRTPALQAAGASWCSSFITSVIRRTCSSWLIIIVAMLFIIGSSRLIIMAMPIIMDSSWAHHLVLEHEEPDQVVDVDPSEDFVVPELVEQLHLRKRRMRIYLPSS